MRNFIVLFSLGIIVLGLLIFWLISNWKLFQKAGKPGWASIIPFYNGWTLAKIDSKPAWWGIIGSFAFGGSRLNSNNHSVSKNALLVFSVVYIISFVFYFLICLGVAKNFGKSTAFGWLLGFLPFIGLPILAFGPATYKEKQLKA